MRRRIFTSIAVVVLAAMAYLALWPVPIAPVAWNPPKAPELTGPYAVNGALAGGTPMFEGIGRGPEDVAFDANGLLYSGFEGGKILRMRLPDGKLEVFADTGGRPLGMAFDSSGNLLVADAKKGLLSISPRQGNPPIRVHMQEIWSGTNFLEISAEICELAGRIAPDSRLRPLDAIHLATFESLRRLEPSAEILTFDDGLRAALSREKGKGTSSGTTSSPRGNRRT